MTAHCIQRYLLEAFSNMFDNNKKKLETPNLCVLHWYCVWEYLQVTINKLVICNKPASCCSTWHDYPILITHLFMYCQTEMLETVTTSLFVNGYHANRHLSVSYIRYKPGHNVMLCTYLTISIYYWAFMKALYSSCDYCWRVKLLRLGIGRMPSSSYSAAYTFLKCATVT